jgi:hypothetical protein
LKVPEPVPEPEVPGYSPELSKISFPLFLASQSSLKCSLRGVFPQRSVLLYDPHGLVYPLNHDRVLAIRTNGEPSWNSRASTVREKRKESMQE